VWDAAADEERDYDEEELVEMEQEQEEDEEDEEEEAVDDSLELSSQRELSTRSIVLMDAEITQQQLSEATVDVEVAGGEDPLAGLLEQVVVSSAPGEARSQQADVAAGELSTMAFSASFLTEAAVAAAAVEQLRMPLALLARVERALSECVDNATGNGTDGPNESEAEEHAAVVLQTFLVLRNVTATYTVRAHHAQPPPSPALVSALLRCMDLLPAVAAASTLHDNQVQPRHPPITHSPSENRNAEGVLETFLSRYF
jgi:hypothetical protein